MQTWEQFHSRGREEPSEELNKLAYAVIGAAIEVHRLLGPGHLESVYRDALCVELKLRGLQVAREFAYALDYKGHAVGSGRLDLLVEGQLVVELKACEHLAPVHTAQILSYLRCTGRQLGLLINFNVALLQDGIKRVISS
jgi:GxxExxY protein